MLIERHAIKKTRAKSFARLREKCLGCEGCCGPCLMLMQLSELPEILLGTGEAHQ